MEIQPPDPIAFADRITVCPLCGGAIGLWSTKAANGQTFHYDRCHACGFTFVNPRPTRESLTRHYMRGSASGVPAAPPVEPGAWPRRAIAHMQRLRRGSGKFLDVGAGNGDFCLAASLAGLSVTALELDPTEAAALGKIPGVRVVAQAFEDFQGPDGEFDYLLMSHVLEHAHDPRAWIAKAARLLGPGGVIAVMLPNFGSIYRLMGGTRDPYFFPPEHLNHFNPRSLGRLCRAFGLRPADVWTTSAFKDDVLTKRILFPKPAAGLVRLATRAASTGLDWLTWAAGCGSVLCLYARKDS